MIGENYPQELAKDQVDTEKLVSDMHMFKNITILGTQSHIFLASILLASLVPVHPMSQKPSSPSGLSSGTAVSPQPSKDPKCASWGPIDCPMAMLVGSSMRRVITCVDADGHEMQSHCPCSSLAAKNQ
jgi:hypothetical protein